MFALGCIQSLSCHTGRCPTGVTTQDAWRQRALVPEDKATRVYNLHRNTLHALAELIGAAGLRHPGEIDRGTSYAEFQATRSGWSPISTNS
jgi:glutamate synthase domain-containing protein 2